MNKTSGPLSLADVRDDIAALPAPQGGRERPPLLGWIANEWLAAAAL